MFEPTDCIASHPEVNGLVRNSAARQDDSPAQPACASPTPTLTSPKTPKQRKPRPELIKFDDWCDNLHRDAEPIRRPYLVVRRELLDAYAPEVAARLTANEIVGRIKHEMVEHPDRWEGRRRNLYILGELCRQLISRIDADPMTTRHKLDEDGYSYGNLVVDGRLAMFEADARRKEVVHTF